MITITKQNASRFGGMWVNGTISNEHTECKFEAKVFEEPSCFGILTPRFENGGNVSRLHLVNNEHELFCFDRHLDYVNPEHKDAVEDMVCEIVMFLEETFCK